MTTANGVSWKNLKSDSVEMDVNMIISAVIVIVAAVFQIYFFRKTQRSRKSYENIFPENTHERLLTSFDEGYVHIKFDESGVSDTFRNILDTINNYLRKNRGATDFAILKDVTERNSDAVEEQIEATAPIPIYIGLCGTLLGIVIGVAVLGFGGGIDALMNYSVDGNENLGASGIRSLLSGVGVAMLTTLVGVVLTIIGSAASKSIYKRAEERKNVFLSWMQEELLPQMNTNMVSTLDILQRNLTKFNESFARNSQNLDNVFAGINESYKEQADILKSIDKLKINDIATANIRVLQELQKCTKEISDLQSFLAQSNRYLTAVESLNKNLSESYERTRLIENMGEFFRTEIEQVEARKAAISRNIGEMDLQLQKAFEELAEHTGNQFAELKSVTAREHAGFLKAVEEQQSALETKLSETGKLYEELQNLTAVKESMGKLVEASSAQGRQIADLIAANSDVLAVCKRQNEILENVAESLRSMSDTPHGNPVMQGTANHKIPVAYVIACGVTCAVLVGTCIYFIVKSLM